jgi:hypothetical protein
MKTIETKHGDLLIDHEDWVAISSLGFRVRVSRDDKGYIHSRVCGTQRDGHPQVLVLSRFLMGLLRDSGDVVVDHINGNSLDNRRCNLRVCTRQQNNINRRKSINTRATSRYKGVYYDKRYNRYYVRVYKDGKKVYGKACQTEVEAALEYNRVAAELFGRFASPNAIFEDGSDPQEGCHPPF